MASSTPTADSDVWVGSVFGLKFGFHALQQRRVTAKRYLIFLIDSEDVVSKMYTMYVARRDDPHFRRRLSGDVCRAPQNGTPTHYQETLVVMDGWNSGTCVRSTMCVGVNVVCQLVNRGRTDECGLSKESNVHRLLLLIVDVVGRILVHGFCQIILLSIDIANCRKCYIKEMDIHII